VLLNLGFICSLVWTTAANTLAICATSPLWAALLSVRLVVLLLLVLLPLPLPLLLLTISMISGGCWTRRRRRAPSRRS